MIQISKEATDIKRLLRIILTGFVLGACSEQAELALGSQETTSSNLRDYRDTQFYLYGGAPQILLGEDNVWSCTGFQSLPKVGVRDFNCNSDRCLIINFDAGLGDFYSSDFLINESDRLSRYLYLPQEGAAGIEELPCVTESNTIYCILPATFYRNCDVVTGFSYNVLENYSQKEDH